MNSMKEVYTKLKNNYKKLDIVYNDNNTIDINYNSYTIHAEEKLVELSKSLCYVNHKVNKNYREVYKTIVSYLEDPEGYINGKRRQIVIVLIISLMLTICIGLILGL